MRKLRRLRRDQLWEVLDSRRCGFRDGTGNWCLVIDADRTLAPVDTGRLIGATLGVDKEIRATFAAGGYTTGTFASVSQIWSRVRKAAYLSAIHDISQVVELHQAWQTVLATLASLVPIVVVTAGIPQVWRAVLDQHGHARVPVIGGCHGALDGFFVDPKAKAEIVTSLRSAGWRVVAAGDSLVDMQMLQAADVSLFVPDLKGSPTLRQELHKIPNVRHFRVDGQVMDGLPSWTAVDLIAHCRKDLKC